MNNKEFKKNTTARGTSLYKIVNEQDNDCARALVLIHFFVVLCKNKNVK